MKNILAAQRWRILCVGLGFLWALVLMVPVLSHKGWPANHEYTASALRMAAVIGQWEAGEPIPVWSSRQQGGYGSPMPGLYHKTHMYLSSAVLVLTGSLKAALVLPVLGFMVIGFCGMCFCLRHALAGRHRWLWPLGGAVLLASNYSITDWVIRGAFAEFAAMMLLPWIFAWCLILISEGRWARWIGPLIALLGLTHSTLGLFCIPVLALACGVACWRWRWGVVRSWLRPFAMSVAIAFVMVLPFALPMVAASRFNRIERLLVEPHFAPWTNTAPWQLYFWDPKWTWKSGWSDHTVQLDTWLLLLLPLYCMLMLRPQARMSGAVDKGVSADRSNAMFLLGTVVLMAWLQLSQATWVYRVVPGAQYLQFAWRLLAYLTVALAICGCIALSRVALWRPHMARRAGPIAAGLCGLALIVFTAYPKMWWKWRNNDWIPAEVFQQDWARGDYIAFGEFLPLVNWPAVGMFGAGDQFQEWRNRLDPGVCHTTAVDQPAERRKSVWQLVCATKAQTALPVFLAPGMTMAMRSNGEGRLAGGARIEDVRRSACALAATRRAERSPGHVSQLDESVQGRIRGRLLRLPP